MSNIEAHPPMAMLETVLAQTPAKPAGIISNGDDARLRSRPQLDDWSAEIVGHLLDTESAYSHRLRLILSGYRPSYPGFDPSAMLGLPRLDLPQILSLLQRAACRQPFSAAEHSRGGLAAYRSASRGGAGDGRA